MDRKKWNRINLKTFSLCEFQNFDVLCVSNDQWIFEVKVGGDAGNLWKLWLGWRKFHGFLKIRRFENCRFMESLLNMKRNIELLKFQILPIGSFWEKSRKSLKYSEKLMSQLNESALQNCSSWVLLSWPTLTLETPIQPSCGTNNYNKWIIIIIILDIGIKLQIHQNCLNS